MQPIVASREEKVASFSKQCYTKITKILRRYAATFVDDVTLSTLVDAGSVTWRVIACQLSFLYYAALIYESKARRSKWSRRVSDCRLAGTEKVDFKIDRSDDPTTGGGDPFFTISPLLPSRPWRARALRYDIPTGTGWDRWDRRTQEGKAIAINFRSDTATIDTRRDRLKCLDTGTLVNLARLKKPPREHFRPAD